jgi:DNA-binding NarL/FixJ family response regulator
MRTGKIRTLIADDQELFRRGLAVLFEKTTDVEVVGEAANGVETVEQTAILKPDLAVIDVFLPKLDGISACRRIRALYPQTEVLFLADSHNENQMRETFEAGGRAFLLKDCGLEELVFAVRKAARGDYYLSGPASQDMVAEYVKPVLKSQRPGGVMTQRERELALLLADGYSTKEAAAVLNISPKTAETHRASIMKKLSAKNVTDIVKYCIRNHIIQP